MEKIKIKMVSLSEETKTWGGFKPDLMKPGWETWCSCSESQIKDSGNLHGTILIEDNKYGINFKGSDFILLKEPSIKKGDVLVSLTNGSTTKENVMFRAFKDGKDLGYTGPDGWKNPGEFRRATPEEIKKYESGVRNLGEPKKKETNFKEGSYIVLIDDFGGNFKKDFIYVVRESIEWLRPKKDFYGSKTNGHSSILFKHKNSTWRDATESEVEAYNKSQKPVSCKNIVESYQPKVGDIVKLLEAGGWSYDHDNNGCLGRVTSVGSRDFSGKEVPSVTGEILNPRTSDTTFSGIPVMYRETDKVIVRLATQSEKDASGLFKKTPNMGDIITFIFSDGTTFKFEVKDSYLHDLARGNNKDIFIKLGYTNALQRYDYCEKAYGYNLKSRGGEFPYFKDNDYAAAGRIIKQLKKDVAAWSSPVPSPVTKKPSYQRKYDKGTVVSFEFACGTILKYKVLSTFLSNLHGSNIQVFEYLGFKTEESRFKYCSPHYGYTPDNGDFPEVNTSSKEEALDKVIDALKRDCLKTYYKQKKDEPKEKLSLGDVGTYVVFLKDTYNERGKKGTVDLIEKPDWLSIFKSFDYPSYVKNGNIKGFLTKKEAEIFSKELLAEHHRTYPVTSDECFKESDTISRETTMKKDFKVGDLVEASPDFRFGSQATSIEGKKMTGRISEISITSWITVVWEDGTTNSYEKIDLIISKNLSKTSVITMDEVILPKKKKNKKNSVKILPNLKAV